MLWHTIAMPLRFILSLLLCFACYFAQAAPQPPEFDLQAFIDTKIAAGEKHIVIPQGQFTVSPKKHEHLRLEGLSNVTIEADGATIICTVQTRAITIVNCENLTLRGLAIDYAPLPFTQGRITAIKNDGLLHEIELFGGYPQTNLSAKKYEIYDPQTFQLQTHTYYGITVTQQTPGKVSVHLPAHAKRRAHSEKIGDWVVLDVARQPSSIPHTIYAENSSGLHFDRVTVHASNSFSFLEVACNGSRYTGCIVDRRPFNSETNPQLEVPRLRSGNADAFHSKNASQGPAYIGCVARYQADDCFAINGHYDLVTAANADTLRILAKTRTFSLKTGDPVEIMDFAGNVFPATVLEVSEEGSATAEESALLRKEQRLRDTLQQQQGNALTRGYRVKLDRTVAPEGWAVIAATSRIGNGFKIIDCEGAFNRSRGIIVKAGNGEIRANRLIGNWGSAILVSPEVWWLEGGTSKNLIIADNTITDCKTISLCIRAQIGKVTAPVGAHSDIVIRNNTISGGPAPAVLVTSVERLAFEGNRISVNPAEQLSPSTLRRYGFDTEPEAVVFINTSLAE